MKKYNYNPMDQFVEKERTRTLLIEAAQGGRATDYWRRVLFVAFIGLGASTYYAATHTQRGRDIVDVLTRDPLADKREARKKRELEAQRVSTASAEHVGVDGGKFDGDTDAVAELQAAQKNQEALGQRLEAFSQGKGPMPAPAEVKLALEGQPAVAQPSPPSAAVNTLPVQNVPIESAAPAASTMSPGSVPYRQVSQVPPAYAQEKQEFPDAP